MDIRALFDVALWEQLQDQLAKLTGTSVICVDRQGIPVSKSSGQSEFCRHIRNNPVTRERCYRCDALAGMEALRLKRPYIYLCHCGIVDAAIPVIMDGNYLGAVLFGQVRISHGDAGVKLERLMEEINSFSPEDDNACNELRRMYAELPEMDYAAVERTAKLISSIVNYIVRRMMLFKEKNKSYEWILSYSDGQDALSASGMQEIRGGEENTEPENKFPVPRSSVIWPALDFIEKHLDEPITMKDMAILCHLSPSYFSRLFGREMGENFVSYVNRKKVQLAKTILMETNKSVSQIASELSYQDSSHFINLFKRFEGITPQAYRQHAYR